MEEESHWQTVLPLLSERPLPVCAGDEVHLEFRVAFGERADRPSAFALRGVLIPLQERRVASLPPALRGASLDRLQARPTPDGKGLGLFAHGAGGFAAGERVLFEAPLLSRSLDAIEREVQEGRAVAEMAAAVETVLRPEQAAQFHALSMSAVHGERKHAYGIWMSNAYPTEEAPTEWGAVFEVASRFNHSCAPNAHIAWNARSRRMTVHALADIAEGEEVTVACEPPPPHDSPCRMPYK